MATTNLQTQKPFSVVLAISITVFLLLLKKVNSSDVLSFSFTKFVPNQKNLLFQGDARVSSRGALQVTKVENGEPIYYSVGRALYAAPVQIWDSSTGKVASFVTSFSFVVNASNPSKTADGIAFFLAPPDSQIPPSSTGGYLGLFSKKFNDKYNQTVAVEFDTYSNAWDPAGKHIGIDVNTINSTETVTWFLRNGEVAKVVINYQASIKTLTASLTYPDIQTSYILSAAVDLKRVLPEWVRVGFSATSGETKDYVETHDVLSWSFTSTWDTSSSSGAIAKENNAHLASYAA